MLDATPFFVLIVSIAQNTKIISILESVSTHSVKRFLTYKRTDLVQRFARNIGNRARFPPDDRRPEARTVFHAMAARGFDSGTPSDLACALTPSSRTSELP